jgi:integrase
MTRTARPPIATPPPGLRQRQRTDGTWRIWWEPSGPARAAGCRAEDLDPARLTWSTRRAADLTRAAEAAVEQHARANRATRTVADLIAALAARPAAACDLAPETRASYAKLDTRIAARWGRTPVARLTKPQVHDWYLRLLPQGIEIARQLITRLSGLMAEAEIMGWRPAGSNPARGLGLASTPPRDRTATAAELAALWQAATDNAAPHLGLAVALSALMGQRQGDLLAVRAADLAGDCWSLTRRKTGAAGSIPIDPAARPWIAAATARAAALGTDALICIDRPGAGPMLPDTFRLCWRGLRAAAAATCPSVADLHFRDLRRTCAAAAHAGGADPLDVGRLLGNSTGSSPRITTTYLPATAAASARAMAARQKGMLQ